MKTLDSRQSRQPIQIDPLVLMRRPHEAFAASRRFAHVPRRAVLELLDDCVGETGSHLLVRAPEGAGKSSLLAYWAHRFGTGHPDRFLIQQYVGCGDGTHDRIDLVRRIIAEIKTRYELPHALPETPEALLRDFGAWLWYVREPVIIAVDELGIDSRSDQPELWLPQSLPHHIRLIATTSDERVTAFWKERGWDVTDLSPLTEAERRTAIRQYVKGRGGSLPRGSVKTLETDRTSANPLLLRTRLIEVHSAAVQAGPDDIIDYYLGAASLGEMYSRFLARVEEEFGPEPARRLFGTLCLVRENIERSDLAALTGEPKFADRLIQRVAPHLEAHGSRLKFSHNALRQASWHRYLEGAGNADTFRQALLEYFSAQPMTRASAGEISEQLRMLERWDELAEYLTRPEVTHLLYANETRFEYLSLLRLLHDRTDLCSAVLAGIERYRQTDRDPESLTDALRSAGDLLQITGHWQEASVIFSGMLDEAERLGNPSAYATACSRVGTIYWRLGRLDEAEQRFEQALTSARSTGDELLAATIIGNLGNLFFSKGSFQQAAELQNINLETVQRMGSSYDVCRISGNLGSTYMRLGEHSKARECFRRMYSIARRNHDVVRIGSAAGNLGNLYYERGHYDRALRYFTRQYRVATRVGNAQQIAMSIGQIGNVYFQLDDPDRAMKAYRKQRQSAGKLHDRLALATSTGNIGLIYLQRGDADTADTWLRAALRLHKRIGNRHGIAQTCRRLGDLEVERGNQEAALRYYRRQFRAAQQTALTVLEEDAKKAIAGLSNTAHIAG